jgi:hypothetical protein
MITNGMKLVTNGTTNGTNGWKKQYMICYVDEFPSDSDVPKYCNSSDRSYLANPKQKCLFPLFETCEFWTRDHKNWSPSSDRLCPPLHIPSFYITLFLKCLNDQKLLLKSFFNHLSTICAVCDPFHTVCDIY